jgi:hypothetical protein
MNPASAQHAALRILLEDVDPLLQRAEEAAQTLTKVREELNADLTTLGELVQRSFDVQPAMLEAGRKLNASASRIEAAMLSGPQAEDFAKQIGPGGRTFWVACATSAVLSGLLVSGIGLAVSGPLLEQARIGRALQTAWPTLDGATRSKVHELLGKS